MIYPNTFEELLHVMQSTEQMKGLSVHAHGLMVQEQYKVLISELDTGQGDPVLLEVYSKIKDKILPDDIVLRYQEYHDCGKPLCRTVDDEGKVHFPDHANVSADVWMHLFPEESVISELMRKDMTFHMAKSEDFDTIWTDPLAPTLYITAWAEILANCTMFGGQDSTSFKIKKKKLIQAGKKYLNSLPK